MIKQFTVITLFPEFISDYLRIGVVGSAVDKGIIKLNLIDLRDFSVARNGRIDDSSYGGGPGMVFAVPPVRAAITSAKINASGDSHVMYMSPQGTCFDQARVEDLRDLEHIIILAGRYEGIDQRLIDQDVDSEWSVGDYVLSGGELPSLIVIDAITRTIPGVLGSDESAKNDSFSNGLLDFPHYTRPAVIEGAQVPQVLLSGNHLEIARWRRKNALGRTYVERPDLISNKFLSDGDRELLREFLQENDFL
jgi:tRNA (guanine37-N1)-methyltransferase